MIKGNYLSKRVGARIPEEKLAYIRANCETMTAGKIAENIGVSKALIYHYCNKHGLNLLKRRVMDGPDETEIARKRGVIRFFKQETEKKPFQRPAAVYGNMSSEDKINYYLSL